MINTNKKRTLLLVDDVKENLDILSGHLQDLYHLKVAVNGQTALKITEKFKDIDLILLDISMPEMDGYEVCRRLKSSPKTRGIPIIFVTANTDISYISQGFKSGGVDYITKPYNPEELLARVNTHLMILNQREKLTLLAGQLGKYLSPDIYKSIFSGEKEVKVYAENKELTLGFTDIVNFTPMSEKMSNKELTEWMNGYFKKMSEILFKHEGTLDKFIGDAVMFFFGDSVSKGIEYDACKCVEAALEMIEVSREMGVEIRCGINTGKLRVGNFGSDNLMEYTVLGDTVNAAARLESHSIPGVILMSESTYKHVHTHFECEFYKDIQVKGISIPMKTWMVKRATRDTK